MMRSRSWIRTRLFWRLGCTLRVLLISVMASGCALWAKPNPPGFERMEIEGEAEVDDEGKLEGDLDADTKLRGVLIGSGAGFVGGLTVGAGTGLAVGQGCAAAGPFYIFCLPVAIIVGGVIGATVGLVGGGVYGGIGGLSGKMATQVDDILLDLQLKRDFSAEIQAAMEQSVPSDIQSREGKSPDAIVTVRLEEVDLRQHYGSKLSIRMWSQMKIQWDLSSSETKSRTCEYEYTTKKAHVDDWIADEGKLFDESFSSSIDTFARWMSHDLEAFAGKTEFSKTKTSPASCYQD